MSLSVARVAVHGEWVRHAPHRAALLGRKERLTAGRWQRDDVVRGLYLADSTETASVGLEAPQPSRTAWAPFQAVGEALWEEGWRGILAPSAARPGSKVLCVFAEKWPPDDCFPVGIEEVSDVPPPPVGMTT